ncbi:MAG: hypothetical protein ACLSGS_09845 [Adlercreutzia sp.]
MCAREGTPSRARPRPNVLVADGGFWRATLSDVISAPCASMGIASSWRRRLASSVVEA